MPIVAFDPRCVDNRVSGNLALYLAINNRCYNKCAQKVGQLHFHTHRLASLTVDDSDHKLHPDTKDFAAYIYSCLIPRGYEAPPRAITFGHAHYKLKQVLQQKQNPAVTVIELIHTLEKITVMSHTMRKDIPALKAAFYLLLDINRMTIPQKHEMRHHPIVKKYMSFEQNTFKLRADTFHPELIDPLIPFLADAFLLANYEPYDPELARRRISYMVTDASMKLEDQMNTSIRRWLSANQYRTLEEVDGILITAEDFKKFYEHTTFEATDSEGASADIPWGSGTLCRDLIKLVEWKMGGGFTFQKWWDSYLPENQHLRKESTDGDAPNISLEYPYSPLSPGRPTIIPEVKPRPAKLTEDELLGLHHFLENEDVGVNVFFAMLRGEDIEDVDGADLTLTEEGVCKIERYLLHNPWALEAFAGLFEGLTFQVMPDEVMEFTDGAEGYFNTMSKELSMPAKEKPNDFKVLARPKSARPKTLPLQSFV